MPSMPRWDTSLEGQWSYEVPTGSASRFEPSCIMKGRRSFLKLLELLPMACWRRQRARLHFRGGSVLVADVSSVVWGSP